MNDRASQLRFARTSYATAWREFIKVANDNGNLLCCFFEGDDLKYYGVRINLILKINNYQKFSVGGREGVLQILELVLTADSGRYAQHPTAFFIDHDFYEPQISNPRLYVTPKYSIENFYINNSVVKDVFVAEFGFNVNDVNYEIATQLYYKSLNSFNEETQLINAWLRQQKSIETQAQANGKTLNSLNLKDISIWDFIKFSIPKSLSKYDLPFLDQKFNRTTSRSDELSIYAWIQNIEYNAEIIHRGKFLMEFLCKFLSQLVEDVNKKSPVLLANHKGVSLTITPKNALSQFSQYAETPECLHNFLGNLRQFLISRNITACT
jgi:hypothetical protein